MSASWWGLPGPSRFVEAVAQSLNDGINVVLSLPRTLPEGLPAALRPHCDNYRSWSSLDVSRTDRSPEDELYERFAGQTTADAIRSVRGLAGDRRFQRRVLWIEGIDRACWPRWCDFLLRYQEACRSIEVTDRSLLCVGLTEDAPVPVPEDLVLVHRRFLGVAGFYDMLLYVNHKVDDVPPDGPDAWIAMLRRDLRIQVVAHLASWDPELGQRLLRRSLDEILDPGPLLKEYAIERGWASLDNGNSESLWLQGAADKIGGRWEVHSALLALRGEERKLRQRLWAAELPVLLPWVESERHVILEEYGEQIREPLRNEYGDSVHDVRDLEIGKVVYFLSRIPDPPNGQRMRYLRNLKNLRNSLAHHEPITARGFNSVIDALKSVRGA